MPTVNGQPYPANRWRESGGTVLTAAGITDGEYLKRSGTTLTSAAVSATAVGQTLNGGRLTLATGTPVTTTDQTAKSTLYFTPFVHDLIGNYNGTTWDTVTFTELSVALSGLTSAKNYDVIFYRNSGTNTIDLMPVWTNNTTRASAIAQQNGCWTNSGSITTVINGHTVAANRGTLIGTIRTTATTTTEDSVAKRFVWNANNRIERYVQAVDATDSWTYTATSYRQTNASSANQVEYVCGLSVDPVVMRSQALAAWSGGGAVRISPGIGVDSTSSNSATILAGMTEVVSIANIAVAAYSGYPGIGYHYIAWLECCGIATSTMTWYGDSGVIGSTSARSSGLYGTVKA